ncbi:pentapeptide repeat-containing protein [Endozoicomonas arenosclerae]|uniref:pentapeptide repeat-containing protein n=1 Tax=Endozoicomonas arenosclerae TaxID=1633495 RepID=UPI000781FF40|nr:pentapeptide repeat-containing protein [Endozoicomonas arenosclerae]
MRVEKKSAEENNASDQPRVFKHRSYVDQDYSNQSLIGAEFEEVDVRYSRFNNSNLEGARFNSSNNQYCDFNQANLKNARFLDCDLQHCDFSTSENLNEFQFCGSNLSYAVLPANFSFDSLDYIRDGARQIWALYLTILLACLYSLLAIGSTNDIDLLGNAKAIFFPMLQMSIATVGFYYVAPVLLMSLMGAFYYQLTVYWHTLRKLPAIFPDGSQVTIKTMPSVIDTVVEACSPVLKASRRHSVFGLIKLELTLVALLSSIPVTLLTYWIRYLPRQDIAGSSLHAFLFAMSVCLAWHTWLVIGRQLPERQLINSSIKTFLFSATLMVGSTLFLLEGPKLPFSSVYMDVSNLNLTQPPEVNDEKNNRYSAMLDGRSLRYARMNKVDFHQSSLRGADLTAASIMESNLSDMVMNHIDARSIRLRYSNIKDSKLRQSNFQRADFHQTDLSGSDFTQSQLNHAVFSNSKMDQSIFSRTDLTESRLDRVNGSKSNFSMAVLNGTTFLQANLPEAIFYLVNVTDAHFWKSNLSNSQWVLATIHETDMTKARLYAADFSQAVLDKSQFVDAEMTSALFLSAKISHVSFKDSQLVNADFSGAQLNNVDFSGSNLKGADFTHTWFEDVDLSGSNLKQVIGLREEQLMNAKFDASTLFPAYINPTLVQSEDR